MKRNLLLLVIAGLVSLSLAACGDSTATTAPAATAAGAAKTAAAPGATTAAAVSLTQLKELGTNLTAASDALKKNDLEATRTAYNKFDAKWEDVEDFIKDKSATLYKEIEDNMTAVKNGLRADKPVAADIQKSLDTLIQKYNSAIDLAGK